MALVFPDRVLENSSTSGAGNITPSGAVSGLWRTIASQMATNDTSYFVVEDSSDNWNLFLGTWDGTALVRTTIISGSDGVNPVNLTGVGVKVYADIPGLFAANRPIPAAGPVASDATALVPLLIRGNLQFVGGINALQTDYDTVTQTGNVNLDETHRGKIIEFTGASASTITLPGSGFVSWWCILKHSGAGTTAATQKLAISGTLDGVTNPAVYPGDCRLIYGVGVATYASLLFSGGKIEILNSDSPFTLTLPPGNAWHTFEAWGGGGGAGGGRRGATSTTRTGGTGGGGGAKNTRRLRTAEIGASSLTVTVAGTAAGGAAAAGDSTNGDNGTVGNNTTFGAILTGFGGGRGIGGTGLPSSGGTGAGLGAVGNTGNSNAAAAGGGATTTSLAGHFAGGGSPTNGTGRESGFAGAGGGGVGLTASYAGGSATAGGGPGGGSGGPISSANAAAAGSAGGSQVGATGGGGAGGAATGANGTAGAAGPSNLGPGTAGGGGGAQVSGVGGSGAEGGLASGGGGGAASLNGNASGAGGAGGAGLARYEYGP